MEVEEETRGETAKDGDGHSVIGGPTLTMRWQKNVRALLFNVSVRNLLIQTLFSFQIPRCKCQRLGGSERVTETT